MGEARNNVVVNTAVAVVAIGGSWGTLSEIALARRADKPVIQVDGWLPEGNGLLNVGSADRQPDELAVSICNRLGLQKKA